MALFQSWCCWAAPDDTDSAHAELACGSIVGCTKSQARTAFRELLAKMKGERQQLLKCAVSTTWLLEIGFLCRVY